MAYIDVETGEVCLRIAYVGDPKGGIRRLTVPHLTLLAGAAASA